MNVAQGGTIRLPATYRNAGGGLVDPVTPAVEIRNPSSAVVANGTPIREDVGEFYVDYIVASDAILGDWIARFSGTVDGLLVFGDELFTVVPFGYVGPGGLITTAEYKTAAGIDITDARYDLRLSQWIPWASQAIRAYTERDFGAPTIIEERTFAYDGSGYLDIDDAAAITSVSFAYPGGQEITLGPDDWSGQPQRRDDAPVYHYILMPGYVGQTAGSPEMGFERNLDVYYRERRNWAIPQTVNVTAAWGWPDVPGDVKMAAVWTIQEWLSRPSGEALTAEAIEGWSRSWGARGAGAAALAIPARARDILANYAKVNQ